MDCCSEKAKIPKVIHYCWFGGKKKPSLVHRCIKSWQIYLPDYKIKEWNEDNFDVNINIYCKQAYDARKWAFVSDVARFYILHKYGGIYFDTDVEAIKSLDNLLDRESFSGFQNHEYVAPGLILGAKENNTIMSEMIEFYNSREFITNDGSPDLTPVTEYFTNILKNHGLITNDKYQECDHISIYPSTYFCPYLVNGRALISQDTYTIHHFAGSWVPMNRKVAIKLGEIFGSSFVSLLVKIKHFLQTIWKSG